MAGKKPTCAVCRKALPAKPIAYAGKKLCSQACKKRLQQAEKKGVCEFC